MHKMHRLDCSYSEHNKNIEGIRLFETNEIINTDNRTCAVNVNLEEYFKEEFSGWYKIDRGVLDLNKRTRRNKFDECMDETLD